MGRNVSERSPSPARGQSSPHKKSPSRREKSPARHRSSHRDSSSVREKRSSRAKSPKRETSRSPPPPARHRSFQRDDGSPHAREKKLSRAQSPRHERSRSPSPRTKRLRRAQADRELEKVMEKDRDRNHGKGDERVAWKGRAMEKLSERERERGHDRGNDRSTHRERVAEQVSEREHDRNHGRGGDKNMHRERGTENGTEGKERRSAREENNGKSYRSRNGQSASPSDRHHRSRHRSQSPSRVDRREHDEVMDSRGTELGNDDDDDSVAKMKAAEEALEAKEKPKPSFELSGKLAAETNRFRGVTLLFNEPPDARKPDIRWRLYVFKASEVLNEPLYVHRQSCYLFGRERRVADIPTDHPSCSKQHAVIQFRQIEKEQPDGTLSKQVRPYIMDLGSTNKTFINDNPIEPQRYYELFEKDTIKFGNSSREYVLLHENSTS